MSILDQIAIASGTDKSSLIHNYCVKYEKYLPFERDQYINILEIGVLGGQSLKMWKEYYLNSKIWGLDINPSCVEYEENRIHIRIGSQTDPKVLEGLGLEGPFDLIVDDGSHMNADVVFSFQRLFPYLRSHGVYVIEDICTSYWPVFGGHFRKEYTSIEYFKRLVDDVNFYGLELPDERAWHRREDQLIPYSKEVQPLCRVDIESINFTNGLIIITKR